MTDEQIESAILNHEKWLEHIRGVLDETTSLVQAIGVAGEKADLEIAKLAQAQQTTEKMLQAFLASRTNGGTSK